MTCVTYATLYLTLVATQISNENTNNLTDFTKCKVSHLGIEYLGDMSKTESWVRCQSWTSNQPHKIPDTITDLQFPEFSRKKAQNYCRNPTRNPDGPWCYSMNIDLKYETCNLPLCSMKECKITGPGMEYAGTISKGASDRKCLKWNKSRSKVKDGSKFISYEKYPKIKFPENDLSKAKKYCRNPNGDNSGPWCFIENEESNEVEKEYCDIPFCHSFNCQVFTKNVKNYSHYTDFNHTLTQFTFGVKLWDPDSYLNGTARLLLSLFALPLTGQEIQDAGIGLEIFISNKKTGLTYGNKDRPDFEETPAILKSTEFTMLTLSWSAPFITLSIENQIKPIFIAEYRLKNTLLEHQKNIFNFYSATGDNIQWSFPFCMDDYECDVHVTTLPQFQQFWPLRNNEISREIQFHLRSFHSAYIIFVASNPKEYPNVKLSLQQNNQMSHVTINYQDSTIIIKELNLSDLLDNWNWHEFTITFFADTMQFFWTKSLGTHMIFEVKHDIFRSLLFFSPSSDTVSYWTFFCYPPEISKPPVALQPECALNQDEDNYIGTQDITSTGLGCLPWASNKLLPTEVKNYNTPYSLFDALNYCRDPSNEKKGTFCFAIAPNKKIEKTYCKLRQCKSENCKMAGTGNDYVGHLMITRSNRECQDWFNAVSIHPEEKDYLNETLFADLSLQDIMNFCRNPSRDIAGPWCYTRDPNVFKDICNVRDCDFPEENIIIAYYSDIARKTYILPKWKISGLDFGIKQWNPDYSDGISFEISSEDNKDKIILLIGAYNNEKIIIKHKDFTKEKTFPHLISSGKWTEFWLIMREKQILLGFKGIPNSFFEYESNDIFNPIFISFGAIERSPLGFFFKSDQCHTENVSGISFSKIYPIGIWQPEQPLHNNLTLNMRGKGIFLIGLMTLPNNLPFYTLQIHIAKKEISLSFKSNTIDVKTVNSSIITAQNWTKIQIQLTENEIKIIKENQIIYVHSTKIIHLIYWFSVSAKEGWILWSANCPILDIDGAPRDGGWSQWSEWQCTVPCGRGEGYRIRNCTNPTPNIKGHLCPGSHKSVGICNDFICGDVSMKTLEKINDDLQTHQFSFEIKEGRSVVLETDAELIKLINKEAPNAYYEWSINGLVIQKREDKIIIENNKMIIRNVQTDDSGVYVYMMYRINKKRVVLRVFSLAVISIDYDIITRATRPFVIPCNAVVLAYIYSNLSLKLYLNNQIYKDFGITMLAAVNSEHFNQLNMSHSGDWKCIVEQKDLKLSWSTNYLRVHVKKAPTFYTNLMEDELTKPIFGWMKNEDQVFYALLLIVIVVIALVLLFLSCYFFCCRIKSRW